MCVLFIGTSIFMYPKALRVGGVQVGRSLQNIDSPVCKFTYTGDLPREALSCYKLVWFGVRSLF